MHSGRHDEQTRRFASRHDDAGILRRASRIKLQSRRWTQGGWIRGASGEHQRRARSRPTTMQQPLCDDPCAAVSACSPPLPPPLGLTVACPFRGGSPVPHLEVATASSSASARRERLSQSDAEIDSASDCSLTCRLNSGTLKAPSCKQHECSPAISDPHLLTSGGSVNELTVHIDKHELPDSSMQQSTRGAVPMGDA